MWSGFQTAVKLVYPPRCVGCGEMVEHDFALCGPCWRETSFIAGAVCHACGAPVVGFEDGFRIECDDCMKRPRPWDQGRSALVYEGLARKLVLGLKHGDRSDLVRPAAQWMAKVAAPLVDPKMLVAPVPLHHTRLLRRKYNQSSLLGSALAKHLGIEFLPDLLVRNKRTPKLENMSVDDRFEILNSAIALNTSRSHRLGDRSVLIVDDVMTSGATLSACTLACLKGGVARVHVLTLARRCRPP